MRKSGILAALAAALSMAAQPAAIAQQAYVYRIPLQGVDARAPTQPGTDPDFESPTTGSFQASGLVGEPISLQLQAQNGIAPISWEVTGLPDGYVQTGAIIGGAPTAPGTHVASVTARDGAGRTAHAQVTLTAIAAQLTLTQNAPELRVGQTFSMGISSNVPNGTYSASGAPGMTLAQDGSGATVSGTATTAGTYPVTASVTRPGTSIHAAGSSSVTVHGALGLSIAQIPGSGGPVNAPATVQNGVGAVTVAVAQGQQALAERGLSFDGSAIRGTLSQGDAASVTLRATDAFDNATAEATVQIPALGGQVASISAPLLRVGDTLSGPYAVTISTDVPAPRCTTTTAVAGVTVAPDCTVSGAPSSPGEHVLAVAVRPASNPAATPVAGSGTLSVAPALTAVATNPNPTLLVGQATSQSLAASGIAGTASYSIPGPSATALAAAGMTFDPSSGTVSGTPAESVDLTYTITVTDSRDNRTAAANFTLKTGAASITLSGSAGSVRVGAPRTYTATSNIQGAKFALSGAPSYVTINADTGVVTTTAPAGQATHDPVPAYDVIAASPSNPALAKTARVTAGSGVIRPALAFAFSDTTIRGNVSATVAPATSGAQTPQVTPGIGSLPPGMTLTTAGITGTPNTAGSYEISVVLTDQADGASKASTAKITVGPMLTVTFTSPNSPLGRGAVGTAMNITASPSNALGMTTFSAVTTSGRPQSLTGLGLSITSAGAITGTPTSAFAGDVNIRMTEVYNGQTNVVDVPLNLLITAPSTAANMIPVVTFQGNDRTTVIYDATANSTNIVTTNFTNTKLRFTFSEPVTINGAFIRVYSTAYGYYTSGALTNVTPGATGTTACSINSIHSVNGAQVSCSPMTGTTFEYDIGSHYTNETFTFRLTYNGQSPIL